MSLQNLFIITGAKIMRAFDRPIKPRWMTYTITWRCNSRCKTCTVWKRKEHGKEMGVSDIKKLFNDPMIKKVEIVKITGGEPFLKPDIADIVNTIHQKINPKVIEITTNGTLTKPIQNFLEQLDPDVNLYMNVSIDGIGKTQDKIRGVKGTYKRAYETLKVLKGAKKKRNIEIGLNQTISDLNINDIDSVYKLANKFGFTYNGFIFIPPKPVWSGKKNKAVKRDEFLYYGKLNKKDIERVIKKLKKKNKFTLKSSGIDLVNKLLLYYYLDGFKNRLLYNKNKPKVKCQELYSIFRLEPNGDILTCSYKPHKIGNVLKNGFSKIWTSKKAQVERKTEVKNCYQCWEGCEVLPSAFYSGQLITWFIKNLFKLRK